MYSKDTNPQYLLWDNNGSIIIIQLQFSNSVPSGKGIYEWNSPMDVLDGYILRTWKSLNTGIILVPKYQ